MLVTVVDTPPEFSKKDNNTEIGSIDVKVREFGAKFNLPDIINLES